VYQHFEGWQTPSQPTVPMYGIPKNSGVGVQLDILFYKLFGCIANYFSVLFGVPVTGAQKKKLTNINVVS
jgi:hypothetical protein